MAMRIPVSQHQREMDNKRIEYCVNNLDRVVGHWDKEFIDSIADYSVERDLTETQRQHLNRIYEYL